MAEKLCSANTLDKWAFCPDCSKRMLIKSESENEYEVTLQCPKCEREFILRRILKRPH